MLASPFLDSAFHGEIGKIDIVREVQHGVARYRHMIIRDMQLRTTLGIQSSPKNLMCYVVMVIRGSVSVNFLESDQVVPEFGIRILTNGVPYGVSIDNECEILVIAMPSWWAMREVVADSVFRGVWSISPDFVTTGALFALVKEITQRRENDPQGDQATQILSTLLRMSLSLQPDDVLCRTTSVPRMSQLLGVISKNLDKEGFSPNEAAAQLRCSLRTLHKTCADHDKTFGRILLEMRLSWAAYKLGYSTNRISEVAFACGFTSLSHFCRSFKESFRMTPGEFRANGIPSRLSL